MYIERRWIAGLAVVLLSIMATVSVAFSQAAHVRWDIVSVNFAVVPNTVSAGEGITASKGFVDYWNRLAPVPAGSAA